MTSIPKPLAPLALCALILTAGTAGAAQQPASDASEAADVPHAVRMATDPNVWTQIMQQLMQGQQPEAACSSCHEPEELAGFTGGHGHAAPPPMYSAGVMASGRGLTNPKLMADPAAALLNPMFIAGMVASLMNSMSMGPAARPPGTIPPPAAPRTPFGTAPQTLDPAQYDRLVKEWSEMMANRVKEARQLAPGAQKEAEPNQ